MVESLKEWVQRKIEKGAIKSYINGEEVILKKSKMWVLGGDWSQIHPPVNEDGSINYVNFIFGGWRNLKLLIISLVLVGLVLLGFHEVFQTHNTLISLPCVQECLNKTANLIVP